MKRFLVWLFTQALSVEVNHVRYVPDWTAIGAVGAAAAAVVGLVSIWYSIRALQRQFQHQAELEAKHLEQELLLRVMDLAQVPCDASRAFVIDILAWRLSGISNNSPDFPLSAYRKVLEEHRRLSTATAAALHVLRRSRPRRFPRGTRDLAFERYQELIQRVISANARMLEYGSSDPAQFDLAVFESKAGTDAFGIADLLRRVTGELLARMYAEGPEWSTLEFAPTPGITDGKGRVGFDFVDETPLGTHR